MNESRVPQFTLGCIFRTYRNFWVSTDFSLVKDPKISIRHKTSTAIASIVYNTFLARFCDSQNLGEKHCHSERSEESLLLNLCKAPLNKVFASFCFCKKKSPPNPQDSNPPNKAYSQNLVKNNSVQSTQTRPLRGAKNRNQGCRSATADFLLEADKRGSPPKSEKRQLLGTHFKRVGESGEGGAALLRKESSEISGDDFAESSPNSVDSAILSQGGLPRATSRARNDKFNNFRRICTRFCVFLILQIPLFASTIDESFAPNKNHSINILSENDAYFEPLIRSDEYYTGGHFISYTSPEFEKSWINYIAGFSHLQDRHFTRFLISINQELYTPDKKYDYDFKAPVNDILFGAGLYANLSFVSRTRDFMEQFSLDLGVVGPLAFGKQVQNGIHRITNNREVFGWDVGALKNEALINLHYGLIYRWVFIEDFFDVLPSFQISLGNALTAINAGVKFRIGYGIKNDFGAQKLHSRFAQNIVGDGLKIYGVFGVRGSIVGRDIFIEGNSFGGAKSGVTINRFLYEFEVGAMIGWKYVSFGYIWSDESKRFKEQSANHEYGSLRLEIMF